MPWKQLEDGVWVRGKPAPMSARDRKLQKIRRERQKWLCKRVEQVTATTKCCGGRDRATGVLCSSHGSIAWATCLACKDYEESPNPTKV